MSDRQDLHELIDHIPASDVPAARKFLRAMIEDPVEASILAAPLDDEPVTAEDIEALDEARASLDRGEGIAHEDIMREFGLISSRYVRGRSTGEENRALVAPSEGRYTGD
jgi:hypothetical protein